MSITDFLYTSNIKLGELIALFLQGDDDKVYIDLYNGNDFDLIFEDIRIIDCRLAEYYNRKVIGLISDNTLGVYIGKEIVKDEETKNQVQHSEDIK